MVYSFDRLEIEGSGKLWRQDQRIRLRHIDTGGYLHSHDKKYSRIAGGQQEVGHTKFTLLSVFLYGLTSDPPLWNNLQWCAGLRC